MIYVFSSQLAGSSLGTPGGIKTPWARTVSVNEYESRRERNQCKSSYTNMK